MLNSVPIQINKAKRQFVLRHPNTMDCSILRKVVLRQDSPPDEEGGGPTIGGIAMLSSDEEDEIDWAEVGEARLLFGEPYQAVAMADRRDSLGEASPEVRAMIECVLDPADPGFFAPKKQDLVVIVPGADIRLVYEVVDIEGGVNIPPFTQRYILNPRDELGYIPAIDDQERNP